MASQKEQIAAGFDRLVNAVNKAAAPSWSEMVFWPSIETTPLSGGRVRSHASGQTIVFRFIPVPYAPTQDKFYANYADGTLTGELASRC